MWCVVECRLDDEVDVEVKVGGLRSSSKNAASVRLTRHLGPKDEQRNAGNWIIRRTWSPSQHRLQGDRLQASILRTLISGLSIHHSSPLKTHQAPIITSSFLIVSLPINMLPSSSIPESTDTPPNIQMIESREPLRRSPSPPEPPSSRPQGTLTGRRQSCAGTC